MGVADLTYWLPYRKRLTDRFMPKPKWLPLLFHKRPFWMIFDINNLGAQKTVRVRQTAPTPCWLVSLAGSSSQAAGFQARVMDVKRFRWWSRSFVDEANICGTGAYRSHLRSPQYVRRGNTILVEIRNKSGATLNGQFVIEAVLDLPRRT